MMRGREKGGGRRMLNVTLGLRFFLFILAFFFKCWHGWTGLVRFGSIGFRLWKPKPNWTGTFLLFFNRLIRFFFQFGFFGFFFQFFRFICFFFLTPNSSNDIFKFYFIWPHVTITDYIDWLSKMRWHYGEEWKH